MTKEEAWLAWMKAAKTTDTPIETDFNLIKKTSWWQAFEAGWDLASVNLNGWDQAYAMGFEAGKEVARADEREACAKVCDDLAAKDKLSNYYAVAARAIRANRSLATTSAGKPNYCTPQVTPQVTPEVTGGVDETAKGEQEPVAWVIEDGEVDYYVDVVAKIKPGTPLYTAPPREKNT